MVLYSQCFDMAKPPNKNTLILSLQFSGDQQSIHYIKTLNGSLVGALNQISLLNEHTLARKSTLRLQLDLESVSKRPGLGFVFACGAVADVELPSVLKQEGIYFRIKFDDMYNLVLHNCLGESMKMSYYDWRRRIDSPDFTLQESIIGLVILFPLIPATKILSTPNNCFPGAAVYPKREDRFVSC